MSTSAEDKERERRRKAMRAALDGKPLTPEITRDEMTEPESAKLSSTDAELLRNVPPHHG